MMIATWKNVPKSFEGFGFMAYQQGKATPKKFVYPYHLLMAFGHAINLDMSWERIPIKVVGRPSKGTSPWWAPWDLGLPLELKSRHGQTWNVSWDKFEMDTKGLLSNEMKNNFIKGFGMNTWNMEIPILQNQIFCIYNTDVSWKLWRFEHERLRKSCPFTHQFGGQLMLRTLTRCSLFRICCLQSFAITTIVMDSQERRNVWQSLQTNWSFSEHTFPLCMLLVAWLVFCFMICQQGTRKIQKSCLMRMRPTTPANAKCREESEW